MNTNTLSSNTMPQAGTIEGRKTKSFARHFPTVARVLLGGFLLLCAFNGILNFLPPPPANLPEAAVAFNAGMMKAGYMFPLIFGTQAIGGALLLLNRFVPLALALLAPFIVNSLAFHLFLVPQGLAIIGVVLALELYLTWSYRSAYCPMLAMRVAPHTN